MKSQQNDAVFQALSKSLKSEFEDSAVWERLCERTRYVLPDWSVVAGVENIRLWLNRLEIKEADYREAMQTSVADMLALNPAWPLRSFVGLLLEFKFSGYNEQAI